MASEAKLTDLCHIYTTLVGEGLSRAKAFATLCQLDYPDSTISLNRQLRTMEATGHALVVARRVSRKPFLDASQEEKVRDFVRTQNSQNTAIALRDVQVFIQDEFNHSVSAMFCSRLMHKLGMSNRKCRTRSSGYKRSPDELVDAYWRFIVHVKRARLIYKEPSLLASIDATYISESNRDAHTWSEVGSGALFPNTARFPRTNAIITMPYADGINRSPCHMWTSNPKCAPLPVDRAPTAKKRSLHAEFLEKCKQFKIDPSRVHFCKDKGLFIGESPEIYRQFLENVDRDVTVFHDGGHSFKQNGVSIFDSLGFKHHVTYPSEVHQYLSPNDFHLHGVKNGWRKEYPKFRDDISATLRLMQLIDQDIVKNSKNYFNDNILSAKKSHVQAVVAHSAKV